MTRPQPFHQATTIETEGKSETMPQPPNARLKKKTEENAPIVMRLVTGEQNAVRKPVILRMKRSEVVADKTPQKTALGTTEVGMPEVWVHRPLCQILQGETEQCLPILTESIRETNAMENKTGDAR